MVSMCSTQPEDHATWVQTDCSFLLKCKILANSETMMVICFNVQLTSLGKGPDSAKLIMSGGQTENIKQIML